MSAWQISARFDFPDDEAVTRVVSSLADAIEDRGGVLLEDVIRIERIEDEAKSRTVTDLDERRRRRGRARS